MFAQTFRFDPGASILVPALPDPANVLSPVRFGVSLTLPRGQSLGRKTSDGLAYPFNKDATDGTQNWMGFNQVAGSTDSAGNFYKFTGGAGGNTFYDAGIEYGQMYTGGVFDPVKVFTSAAGTAVAEVDTITPTNPTTGDIYSVITQGGDAISFTVGATQTATATVTGLKAAWNANPVTAALATASGTATLILTGKTLGQALNLTASAIGTGTTALVVTTPAADGQGAEVDTFTATNPTTGDVYTLTINTPGGVAKTISATVGATQTATAIDALLVAAWNADPVANAYAVASGTTTLILTSAIPGNVMNVTGSVVGTGTIAKVVTTPAFGRNLADVQASRPGAYLLQPYGYWRIP